MNVQAAVMYVVDASEENGGKMRHQYVGYDPCEEYNEDQDQSQSAALVQKSSGGKKDLEMGSPTVEVCYICQNTRDMHLNNLVHEDDSEP